MRRNYVNGPPVEGEVCRPSSECLPSGNAAIDLMKGGDDWPEKLAKVGGTVAVRGALVAIGLLVAGVRGKRLLEYTVAAVAGIETGVLAWAAYQVYGNPKK